MQPVTIKNKDYSNTLWLSQLVLVLMSVGVLWLGLTIDLSFWIALPVFMIMFYINKQTLTEQSTLQFMMHANGKLTLKHAIMNDQNHASDVFVKAVWYVPQVMVLKLTINPNQKPVYLTVFRSVIGPASFSLLLVGLTQLNHSINERRTSHV